MIADSISPSKMQISRERIQEIIFQKTQNRFSASCSFSSLRNFLLEMIRPYSTQKSSLLDNNFSQTFCFATNKACFTLLGTVQILLRDF